MATLQPGALTPSQTQQTSSKKAVSLIDSLLNTPTLAQGTSITPTLQNVQTNELMATPGVTGTVAAQSATAAAPSATAATGATGQTVATMTPATASQFTASTIGTAPTMQAAQGTVTAPMTAATQSLANIDPRATVQGQLENISTDIQQSLQQGTPLPAFARGAAEAAKATMQARGLGSSSMAAAAMTQAVLESGVAIAGQDANKYATIQLQNLAGQQKVALQNALTYAAMDKANLSARLQGAVTNAQALLSVDVKNLDAQQKTNTINFNALTQALFKDSAEENARQQFNAKNQLQVEEFFAELDSQVETANSNRIAAMRQFGISAGQLEAKLGAINAVAGSFSVEAADISFAIRRTGGAFKAAGGQLEELIALFTSVRSTTRESAETIATGFRTIFTRIQRPQTIA